MELVVHLISFRALLLAQDHQVGLQEEEADPGGGRGRRRGAGAGFSRNYFLSLVLNDHFIFRSTPSCSG